VEIVDLKLFIIDSKVVTGYERNHFVLSSKKSDLRRK
jgi:hypothetical protein